MTIPEPTVEEVITEEIAKRKRAIDAEWNSYRVNLALKELSAWLALQAVLAMPERAGDTVFQPQRGTYYDFGYNQALSEIREAIERELK